MSEQGTSFGLADIMNMPEPEAKTETRSFKAKGREWSITLRCLAEDASAEEYFAIAQIADGSGRDIKPLTIQLPPPTSKTIEIKDPAYLASLHYLASITVAPAFGAYEWAVFGHKAGGRVMNEIFGWGAELNGLSEVQVSEAVAEAKNA